MWSNLYSTLTATMPHEHLPLYLRELASYALLEDVPYADYYLAVTILLLLVLIIVQLRAFVRPPPVPLKRLPRRPLLSVLFKPDDISTTFQTTNAATTLPSITEASYPTRFRTSASSSVTSSIFRTKEDPENLSHTPESKESEEELSHTPILHSMDLPDSFAPLLSSSQMDILWQQLTADLIHACHVEGGVRLRHGRQEIPLDKDNSRPQLVLDIPKGGCRLSAGASIGSDGFTSEQDLDVNHKTTLRSKPMVKHASLVLDPPLPLSNVAPTLIHFPRLFEDSSVPTLRRIQIVRIFMDFVVSASSLIEKCLWILESKCQIHLSKIAITPIYKGRTDDSPEWRLQLAFSGHLLLFHWIPLPFISFTLPTFIIPQPHALLEYLLSAQPLASARLRRENINHERIVLALLEPVETWHSHIKLVATPPAIGVDVTFPGGVTFAVELGLGRDPSAGKTRAETETRATATEMVGSVNSLSSWTTSQENTSSLPPFRRVNSPSASVSTPPFDANHMVPWSLELKLKGSMSREKLSFHILKCELLHEGIYGGFPSRSKIDTGGSVAVWKVDPNKFNEDLGPVPLRRRSSFGHRKKGSFGGVHPELEVDESPSVTAILLFPDETTSFHRDTRLVQYDYAFDVSDDTKIDAITLSVGASHPFLNGATMITAILDSIYAFGSFTARDDAILDPLERRRKRNVLRHLPAADFTFGIQNIFIPQESNSYSDDGQTLFLPEVDGGRMMVHIIGGIDSATDTNSFVSSDSNIPAVSEGLRIVADFEVASLNLRTEGAVKEFPELDIFDGVKLRTVLSGIVGGRVTAYLRPQELNTPVSTTGRNIFNPLEAYEIVFSGSNLSLKLKEYSATLGHRRIIFPAETTFVFQVIESIVDMGFEGKTQCDLSWDFQGLSPILQVTPVGQSPEDAEPESKRQASLLIAPLRQGRLSLRVSSVGGINITKAATSREDKEGLFDWKFFNAIISPDEESAGRIMDVLHDKRTMDKLLTVAKLINEDLHRILDYSLRQIWHAKEILDKEGVSDPGHAIPMYKMARLISLFLTNDVDEVNEILPIVRRVVAGEGLDVVKVKDLLRKHMHHYDEWAPELDRVVRWAALLLGPMAASQPYVEDDVRPLSALPHFAAKFRKIPSANDLYDRIIDKLQLPLDPAFSSLVSRLAPYLSFRQIEYILQVRSATDWQPQDLRRIRYVYSIKRKVLDIAESYGGLSFLPQSFLVSVFLGEATRNSLRVSQIRKAPRRQHADTPMSTTPSKFSSGFPTISNLRRRKPTLSGGSRLQRVAESVDEDDMMSPAERVASMGNFDDLIPHNVPEKLIFSMETDDVEDDYELGDCLLGPQDVAVLLQSGLTSVMKSSTVVQLNQRMLIDLICSQPNSFAVAVLAELASSARALTSALMALLEIDQTAFVPHHRIEMHALLESWLPGVKIPRREDYMAGGRWARQSYYEALFAVAESIVDDSETYIALKCHLQTVRRSAENDPVPGPRNESKNASENDDSTESSLSHSVKMSKLDQAVEDTKKLVAEADQLGEIVKEMLLDDEVVAKDSDEYERVLDLYSKAFDGCRKVMSLDRHAFHADWFANFYKRNYDALMIKSIFDNIMDNTDEVRYWLQALRNGSQRQEQPDRLDGSAHYHEDGCVDSSSPDKAKQTISTESWETVQSESLSVEHCRDYGDGLFIHPDKARDQVLVDAIIDAIIYEKEDKERLRLDPLVRLLIPNTSGNYNFTIVSAMGVITEGKRGLELKDAFHRLEELRGVKVIRADTGTARSLEYNAAKIEEAIEVAAAMKKPFGLLGYSQGCANALQAETILLSGSPRQQQLLVSQEGGLVCRQLLFSAANGSFHGPATGKKIQRLIVMCEEFFKYNQGFVSRALSSFVLETLNSILDSAAFHKFMGGAHSFLPEGCRAFWRESQHLAHVPTCTLRGVLEKHTTPESLEMLANLLTKQSGSPLHDSQVHVFDAVGHPVYYINRNGRLLKNCDIGGGAIQRTHHWSPLSDEVEFVRTNKDIEMASFDCAKDRHVFPWVEVNVRFGFIKYAEAESRHPTLPKEVHPKRLIHPETPEKPMHSIALYTMSPT